MALDPKENYVGNTVLWDGRCPFCREHTNRCKASCGWQGDATLSYNLPTNVKMLALCTKVAPAQSQPQPATPAPFKPLDPKENYVGNTVPWDGKYHCPFCGGKSGSKGPCGWDGNCPNTPGGGYDPTKIKMTRACAKTPIAVAVPAKPANPNGPQAKKDKAMSISLLPVKPRINCPACGAYGADKHRIGCKGNDKCQV